MPRDIRVGLSMMLERDWLDATLPLFERGVVDALEWSVDLGWGPAAIPEWGEELLAEYGDAGRLYGHGVHLSPLSATWLPRQDAWLAQLARGRTAHPFALLSEHFGFSTTPGYPIGAPFPVPYCDAALAAGHMHLAKLAEVAGASVGLENLAIAFDERDVWSQGEFIDRLVAPIEGFVLLDLHNLYCQIQNFGCDPDALLDSYPLDRVRVVHVSGGSWSHPTLGAIRQDTHDGAVPNDVFALLEKTLSITSNVEAVILERLGGTMYDAADREQFNADYETMRRLVHHRPERAPVGVDRAATPRHAVTSHAITDLGAYQVALLDALTGGEERAARFGEQSHAWSHMTRSFDPRMLKLGARIAAKYTRKDGCA